MKDSSSVSVKVTLPNGEQIAAWERDAEGKLINPIQPMQRWEVTTDEHQIRRLGKTVEEMGELLAVLGRILVQGIDSIDPATSKANRARLTDETADVLAQLKCNATTFAIDALAVNARVKRKMELMAEWEAHFGVDGS